MSEPTSTGVLSARDLKRIAEEKETAKLQEYLAKKRAAEEEEQKALNEFMERDVRPDAVDRFNQMVRRAAEEGHSEILVTQFPSHFCTDRGRAINNFDPSWPETLTGFAKKVHEKFTVVLEPQGYKIRAQILNYPDGGLGDVGIYIGW